MTTDYPYFAIVTFGEPSYGRDERWFRSLDRAIRTLRTLGGGTMTTARIVGCPTRAAAIDADISGCLPVVYEA